MDSNHHSYPTGTFRTVSETAEKTFSLKNIFKNIK